MKKRYARIAAVRAREVKTRVGFAVFIAITVWALAPSPWPLVWLALVVTGQTMDAFVFGRIRKLGSRPLTGMHRAAACVSLFVNTQ